MQVVTIYGPMIYTAPYVMCLMGANPVPTWAIGRVGPRKSGLFWAMKGRTFLGPETARAKQELFGPKKVESGQSEVHR